MHLIAALSLAFLASVMFKVARRREGGGDVSSMIGVASETMVCARLCEGNSMVASRSITVANFAGIQALTLLYSEVFVI